MSLREQAEVPAGHYRRVLMTRDWNPLDNKVLEFKFYARGVGPVLAVCLSGGSDARSWSASSGDRSRGGPGAQSELQLEAQVMLMLFAVGVVTDDPVV